MASWRGRGIVTEQGLVSSPVRLRQARLEVEFIDLIGVSRWAWVNHIQYYTRRKENLANLEKFIIPGLWPTLRIPTP
jgi:hypothetical protein